MGHQISYYSYSENHNKAEIMAELNTVVACEDYQEGASGLDKPIRWIDTILSNREEAEKYIQQHDSGNYDQLAVKYYSDVGLKQSKTLQKLEIQKREAFVKYLEIRNSFHFEGVKSSTIGCTHCGSKISTKYLHDNFCPVCSFDMRPATTKERIEVAKQKYEKLKEQARKQKCKEMLKQRTNQPINWLVKIEYHT